MSQDPRGVPRPPPGGSKLPFTPGAVIGKVPKASVNPDAPELTEMEQSILSQVNWQPGDPIPDLADTGVGRRLNEAFTKVRTDANDLEGMTPLPPGTPPIKPPTMRDITELSATEKAEVVAALAQAKVQEKLARSVDESAQLAGVPGLQEAYRTATADTGIELVDDTLLPPTPSSRLPAEPTDFNPTAAPPPPPPAPEPVVEAPPEPAAEAELDAGTEIQPDPLCQRCGHMLTQDVVIPADADKQGFLQTVLGGQRFRKTYKVFGGNMGFTLRTLLPGESELALSQLDHDVKAEKVLSHAQYMRQLADFRLAMSLEEFQRADGAPVKLRPIGDMEYDTGEFSALPQLLDYVQNTLFVTDSVRRTIGMEWQRFQRLVELMEARADAADFWPAIEQVALL